jgi:hypothetical protein
MNKLATFLLVIAFSCTPAFAQVAVRPTPSPTPTVEQPKPKVEEKSLSEVSQLKAENLKLRAQIAQLKIDLMDRESQLAGKTLSAQQVLLEQQFRKELGCTADDTFNWATLKCEKKKAD